MSKFSFPGQITCMVSHPMPPKLTLWEWLGLKPRPLVIPARLYVAVGSVVFISSADGEFDYGLHEQQAEGGNDAK